MLDILGRRYVLGHCINYLNKTAEEHAYRVYITDALKAITENTGRLIKDGMAMSARFVDLVSEEKSHETDDSMTDNERAQNVITNIKNKLAILNRKEDTDGNGSGSVGSDSSINT